MSNPSTPCTHPSTVSRSKDITTKRRPKFGFGWVVLTVITGGFAILLWLVMPRRKEVIAVDRWSECTVCGAKV